MKGFGNIGKMKALSQSLLSEMICMVTLRQSALLVLDQPT